MSLPEPVIRPDAVDHYDRLLSSDALPSDSFCLTAVRGLGVDEALTRFGGIPRWREADLGETGVRSVNAYPDELLTVVAGEVSGWVLLAENNGWHGAKADVLQQLSRDTVVASAFWNVNFHSTLSLACGGELLGAFDFVIGTERPDALLPYLDGLAFDDPYRKCAESLAFVERVSGTRLTEEWATTPHQASAIVDLRRFLPKDPTVWLRSNEPELLDWAATASSDDVRAAAAETARAACAAVDIPAEATLDDVRRDYTRTLQLRWDRCAPPDPALDRIAQLQASVTRHRTEPAEERLAEKRAHARAAVIAARCDNPVDALAAARCNAVRAGRAR
ncbi:hypothetical protein BBK82_06775 [Lentzea guizhouensis]|uniref:Uncharacterized protein n=1 Tax=Lentzea guizhouensis TaxID=1586287 RepID=A0A1B2HDQ7_9PSEU|nr:DUF6461 domain-containing protein [Lentzea guizhouensis]ANZ35832.1 hypothetical protein BBK82_06775 [Lentzea guizhouensis]